MGQAAGFGEAIGWASGSATSAFVFTLIFRQPQHTSILLSRRFTHVGIGVTPGSPFGGPGATVTMDFGWRR